MCPSPPLIVVTGTGRAVDKTQVQHAMSIQPHSSTTNCLRTPLQIFECLAGQVLRMGWRFHNRFNIPVKNQPVSIVVLLQFQHLPFV